MFQFKLWSNDAIIITFRWKHATSSIYRTVWLNNKFLLKWLFLNDFVGLLITLGTCLPYISALLWKNDVACSLYNANFKITHLKKYIELPWFFFSKCDDLVQYLTHHQSALPQPITSSFVKLNLIENWLIWWKKKINIQIHVSSNKLCYLERQSYMYHQFLMKYSTIHRND